MAAKPQIIIPRTLNLLLPTLISALKSPENPCSLPILKSCSAKLLYILQNSSSSSSSSLLNTHLNTIFALIPHMMFCKEIVGTVAKIVGYLSLVSIEVNEMIAQDGVVLKSLLLKIVGSDDKLVLKRDLVNVLLDVSVTCLGRQRLLQVCGLDYILLGFLQVKIAMAVSISIVTVKKDGDLYLGAVLSQDEVPLLLLNAAVTLANFCDSDQLKRIPRKLIEAVIPHWKEIWAKVHKQLLASEIMKYSRAKCCYLSNVTVYNLAESIFRLSMYCPGPSLTCAIPSDDVIGHLFGTEASGFKTFMFEHWESSPFLMRKQLRDMDRPHDVFSSFMHSVHSEEKVPEFLSSLLRGMVSCPPVALDEIDALNLLHDVRDTLGSPVIYQQDFRVVKTELKSKIEKHYFNGSLSKGTLDSQSFSSDDILKCEAAYREGYTVAIRGMEYRLKNIAAITQFVANLFGQPSVGANLYVTPPGSQGLACHCDDHCVFVCQLRGTKEWNVFSRPVVQLPRLYEHHEVPQESCMDSKQILLREGDVLYIPRGFAHEAHTVSDLSENNRNINFSAHLTLAIEVEPPFEWEGFAHVALHGWSCGKQSDKHFSDTSGNLQVISVNILHVAIRLISRTEPVFRKACLVAASSLPPDTKCWFDDNQRAVFSQVTNTILEFANFTDSVNFVRMAIQRNEDPFSWLRWLDHLNEEATLDHNIFDSTLAEISKNLSFVDDRHNLEAAFAHIKAKFCDEVLYDDARGRFKNLHSMYKEVRLQYMNGMLSLHC